MDGEEVMDLVDEHDSIVGASTVEASLEGGLLHRAVAVIVVRSDGRVVLQERSKRDPWHPGRWTLSCTGHVKSGESYDAAASRELSEELGLQAKLTPLKKYLLPPMTEGDLTEHEWVALYSARTDSPVKIDQVELESAREFTRPQLRKMLDGEELTPDAIILLTEYLRLSPPEK